MADIPAEVQEEFHDQLDEYADELWDKLCGHFELARDARDAEFREEDHPRGQPGNAGQFGSGGGEAEAVPWHRDMFGKWTGEKPTTFYRGTIVGGKRSVAGDPFWDQQLFASSKPEDAEGYGPNVEKLTAKPDAKILYEGTREFRQFAKGVKGNLLDTSTAIAQRAKAAGYDAVWFERQSDVGTAINNSDVFNRNVAGDAGFNEQDHPRGQPGNAGQFAKKGTGGGGSKSKTKSETPTSSGGEGSLERKRQQASRRTAPIPSPEIQLENVKGFLGFQEMVAEMQGKNPLPAGIKTTPSQFLLDYGRQFAADDLTYAGKRMKPQQCFSNAGQIALMDPSKTYVEGKLLVYGVPIDHAWVVNSEGKVEDPTIKDPQGIAGYFGVPIKTRYLQNYILKHKVWGVFSNWYTLDYLKDNPSDIVEPGLGTRVAPTGKTTKSKHDSAMGLLEEYSKEVTPEAIMAEMPKEVGQAVRRVEHMLSQSVPTDAPVSQGGFKNPDGSYTPERQALHNSIIRKILSDEAVERARPKEGEAPTFSIIGGRAGSGKSYFTKAGIVSTDSSLVIDNDEIKGMLPEYKGWNAGLLHEEASDIFGRVDRIARDLGLNIAHDATMKTYENARRYVDAYKEKGYKVHGYYMFCPPQEAAKRALGRFMEGTTSDSPTTGRYVPPSYVLNSRSNEASFDALRDSFDSWKLYKSYDTGEQFKPEMVKESGDV